MSPLAHTKVDASNDASLAAELADMKLLQEISAQLIEQGNEDSLYEKIVDAIAAIMRSDFATMQVLYPERGPAGELRLLTHRGLTPEGAKLWEWVSVVTDSTCGHALRTGKRAIANDVATSDFLAGTPGAAALMEAGIFAAQSTPLVSRTGELLGMVSSHWRKPHMPSERDLRLLDILARQAADLIERKRVEEELRRANHDLQQFAHSASHDLREPLRTIKIYAGLLDNAKTDENESVKFREFVQSAATRMERMVQDLLDYTHIVRLSSPIEEIDANEALQDVLTNLSGIIFQHNATVAADRLPRLRMHGTHMRQLFQNLIGNAIKYRSPDRAPAVHVNARRETDGWVFTVRDNGIGIEPQYREQIFGLFSRLHSADVYEGTGIGLAICQRIVEHYHGRIWVDAEPSGGSAFSFVIRD